MIITINPTTERESKMLRIDQVHPNDLPSVHKQPEPIDPRGVTVGRVVIHNGELYTVLEISHYFMSPNTFGSHADGYRITAQNSRGTLEADYLRFTPLSDVLKFNLYIFKVTYADGTRGQRNIPQNTYNGALNDLYFPGDDFGHIPTVNAAELIGLRVGSTWKGDQALENPGQFDRTDV